MTRIRDPHRGLQQAHWDFRKWSSNPENSSGASPMLSRNAVSDCFARACLIFKPETSSWGAGGCSVSDCLDSVASILELVMGGGEVGSDSAKLDSEYSLRGSTISLGILALEPGRSDLKDSLGTSPVSLGILVSVLLVGACSRFKSYSGDWLEASLMSSAILLSDCFAGECSTFEPVMGGSRAGAKSVSDCLDRAASIFGLVIDRGEAGNSSSDLGLEYPRPSLSLLLNESKLLK